ncbi:MAG TPA: amidohydrolase family protein [Pyrinomonadaceae bacterium]|nr:amidohydrolase family protein [Pyrinomonadaceae bacterium]
MKNQKIYFGLISLIFGIFLAINALAQSDGSQQNKVGRAGTFAIVSVRIYPVTGPVIENGTIVIQNGKIAAFGTGVSIPSGAERIDGKGLTVYPGMIDSATSLGLVEVPQGINGSVDVAETGTNNANAKAIIGVNPHSAHVNVTRVNGITTVLTAPSGGLIAGQSAVIDLAGSTQAEMAVVPEFALVINFPRVATGGGGFGGFGGFGQQIDFAEAVRRRDAQVEELKKLFAEAENYGRARDAAMQDKSLPVPDVNLRLEAMIPYVRGQKPIIFTVERERDIRAVIKFATEMKVKAIIVGGQEAWKVADDLKKNNIPVIYTNIYALPPRDDDAYDSLFEAPSKMLKAGIKFAIATGEFGAENRDLPYHAGLAGAYGLSKEEAIKAVTIYPAEILGVADKLGSIENGKIANLVVTDGELLDPRTNVKYVFIEGRMIPLTSRHTDLFDSFKDRP